MNTFLFNKFLKKKLREKSKGEKPVIIAQNYYFSTNAKIKNNFCLIKTN